MFSYSTHLTLVWILWSYIKNATFSKSLFINMFHFTHRWKFVKWNIHDVIAKPRLEKTKKNYSLLILDAKHTKPSLLGSILLMCSTELRNMLTWIRITLRTVSSLPKHGHTMKQCRSNRILVIFVYIKQCLIYFFLFHIFPMLWYIKISFNVSVTYTPRNMIQIMLANAKGRMIKWLVSQFPVNLILDIYWEEKVLTSHLLDP